ncbi:hypothetical protein TNCT_664411 [Trichonephila clavata]|uniref:Secreted protein n=1 Tax=Trichonephila clavata TaxID=2740835 RepID=A0A8X6EXB9_TRICU|nr:hypothetical protein TNCT_664411 [Trichonephila clavata]
MPSQRKLHMCHLLVNLPLTNWALAKDSQPLRERAAKVEYTILTASTLVKPLDQNMNWSGNSRTGRTVCVWPYP